MCEPVTIGLAVANSTTLIAATSAGFAAAAGVAAGAAVGAAWGVGINAAVNVATGRGAFENAGKAALFGAVSAGIGTYAKPFADVAAMGGGGFLGSVASYAVTAGSATSIGLSTAAGSLLGAMTPDPAQFGYGAQPYQGYSSQQTTVTGSGGRQAAAVLAEEMKKAKTFRQRQQEETTAYSVAGGLSSTGLQIAA